MRDHVRICGNPGRATGRGDLVGRALRLPLRLERVRLRSVRTPSAYAPGSARSLLLDSAQRGDWTAASRKPRLKPRYDGESLSRYADRQYAAVKFQLPPRSTR